MFAGIPVFVHCFWNFLFKKRQYELNNRLTENGNLSVKSDIEIKKRKEIQLVNNNTSWLTEPCTLTLYIVTVSRTKQGEWHETIRFSRNGKHNSQTKLHTFQLYENNNAYTYTIQLSIHSPEGDNNSWRNIALSSLPLGRTTPPPISNEPCPSAYISWTSDRLLLCAGWFSRGKSAVWPPIDPLRSCLRYALNPLRRALNQTTPAPRIQSPISIVTPRYAVPTLLPRSRNYWHLYIHQSSNPWKLIRIAFAPGHELVSNQIGLL